ESVSRPTRRARLLGRHLVWRPSSPAWESPLHSLRLVSPPREGKGKPLGRHSSFKLCVCFSEISPMTTRTYKRVLLKLSGEALMGEDAFGINRSTILRMTEEILTVAQNGVELAIVIGGGNIFRGIAPGAQGMDRATADYMGMMATVLNALALQDALKHGGVDARVQSGLRTEQLVRA